MRRDSIHLRIDHHSFALTHPGKVFFPKTGITKRELVEYYAKIASVQFPHIQGRLLSFERYPNGVGRKGFFQKEIPEYFPEWIERATVDKQHGVITQVVASDSAIIAYLANQGCITPHVSLSRADQIDRPDRMIFDLDPPGDDFTMAQEGARVIKELLDEAKLPSFVQITGSRGLHVAVPLDRSEPFDNVGELARAIAAHAGRLHPDMLTVEQRKDKRGRRVFIDYMRNAYGQTTVAPYAVRPRESAPVATPLTWSEAMSNDLTAQEYNIKNIFRRLANTNDPWTTIDRHATSLGEAREIFLARSWRRAHLSVHADLN